MTGSWVGYVLAIAFCGVIMLLVFGSAALLIAVHRMRRQKSPRVTVVSVSAHREPS